MNYSYIRWTNTRTQTLSLKFDVFCSDSFNVVQQKSDVYWRKKQNCFLEEYSIKTVFPVHLQLLALPGIILAVLWFGYSYFTDNIPKTSDVDVLDKHPMFVRGKL